MRKVSVVVLMAALLAGCSSARVNIGATSGTGTGTSVTSGSAGLHIQGGSSGFGAALIAMMLLAGAIEYSKEDRPFPSPSALIPGNTPPAPRLAPERRVHEQDCTKPIDFSAGNVRCK
jgi:hypothetical protein